MSRISSTVARDTSLQSVKSASKYFGGCLAYNKQREAAEMIIYQIRQNEEDRLLELERLEQEKIVIKRRFDEEMEQELQARLARYEANRLALEELNKSNATLIEHRRRELEKEAVINRRIDEEHRKIVERQEQMLFEKEKKKQMKDLEIARMMAKQNQERHIQDERDRLRAKRVLEQADREWRDKEADSVRRQQDTIQQMREARAKQVEQYQKVMAVQAAKDMIEFQRVLKAQKAMIEKEKREADQVRGRRAQYLSELKRQIRDREQQQIAERREIYEEGEKLKEETRLRAVRLQEAKERKLVELRNSGVPPKYMEQVEAKIMRSFPMK